MTEKKPWEKFSFVDIFLYLILALIGICMFFPLWNGLVLSFNDGKDAVTGGIYFYPRVFTLANYTYAFQDIALWKAFGVSVVRAFSGVVSTLLVTTLFAYAVSKPHLKFRKVYMVMVMISMFFSGGMIPMYLTIKSLGLLNTFWVYIVTWMFNAFYAQIVLSYFRGLPPSLCESAKIDGAGEFTIYARIILPLSKPVLSAVGMFVAINHWNAWNDNMLYVKNKNLTTLSYLFVEMIRRQQALEGMAASTGTLETSMMAGVSSTSLQLATMMVSIVPIMLVYPFAQRYFTSGVMIGSVKG